MTINKKKHSNLIYCINIGLFLISLNFAPNYYLLLIKFAEIKKNYVVFKEFCSIKKKIAHVITISLDLSKPVSRINL